MGQGQTIRLPFTSPPMRALSNLLIVCGLGIAGLGLESVWTSWHSQTIAEQQWDRQIAHRPATQQAPASIGKGEILARLSIDRLDSRWVVLEGAGRGELKRGPGHLSDSALPGAAGNCVIAGHRDTQFRVLRNVKLGEKISIETGGRTFIYRVTGRRVVAPTDTESLDPTATPTLTLVTCYPFYYVGPAPKRFVIRAELVSRPA
jgi:sortase A